MPLLSFRTFCLLLALLAPAAAQASEIFTASTLSRARSDAEAEHRLIVVYLYQSGDAACEAMEREAWHHGDVTAWVQANAVAAKVDVGSMHGASLKGRYGVDKVPAILAFRGEDLARKVEGPVDGDALTAWLEVARSGNVAAADALTAASSVGPSTPGPEASAAKKKKKRSKKERQAAAPAPPPPPRTGDDLNVEAALTDALSAGSSEDQIEALTGTWVLTTGTVQQDPRRPRLIDAFRPLIAESFDANERVQRLRDTAWTRWELHHLVPDLVDWVQLNHLLQEDAATLRWVRSARLTDPGKDALARVLDHPEDPLVPILMRKGEWLVIGESLRAVHVAINQRHIHYKATKITVTGAEPAADKQFHREVLAALCAGLLAAGREREAKEATDQILGFDPGAGPILVATALEAGQAQRWHRPLVNISDKDQVELAMNLAKALEGL